MTRRTLTDELRSVLLSHSLDAPEPADTVTRILAGTVGPTVGTAQPAVGTGQPAGGIPQPAGEDSKPATGRRRWRPSGQLLIAACIVAVIVLAAAGINTARHRNPAPTSANAAQGSAGSAQSSASSARSAASQHSSANARGPMLVPQVSDGRRAAPASPPTYFGSTLDCSKLPGGHLVTGAWDDFQLSNTGQQRYVYEFLCVGSDGQRSASEVQMFESAGGKLRYVMTLLRPNADEHLDFITATTDSVRIQYSVNRNPSGAPAGAVESMAWEFSDPNGGSGMGAVVAEPCLRKDLEASVIAAAGSSASWRLVLHNRTGVACALEGFPTVIAMRSGTALAGAAAHKLSGPAGGVRKGLVPPIIVLSPGATAAAVLESSATPSCPTSDDVAVELPNGVSLGRLIAAVPACGLVVHPLVGNPSGSD